MLSLSELPLIEVLFHENETSVVEELVAFVGVTSVGVLGAVTSTRIDRDVYKVLSEPLEALTRH